MHVENTMGVVLGWEEGETGWRKSRNNCNGINDKNKNKNFNNKMHGNNKIKIVASFGDREYREA